MADFTNGGVLPGPKIRHFRGLTVQVYTYSRFRVTVIGKIDAQTAVDFLSFKENPFGAGATL